MTMPENVEQDASPFWLMVTPAGVGMVENGFPIDQRTCGTADIGAILKLPITVNCTCLEVLCALAAAGVTVRAWSCREVADIMMLPPHDVIERKQGMISKEARENFISAS